MYGPTPSFRASICVMVWILVSVFALAKLALEKLRLVRRILGSKKCLLSAACNAVCQSVRRSRSRVGNMYRYGIYGKLRTGFANVCLTRDAGSEALC